MTFDDVALALDDIVAYWQLGEPSGGTSADDVGNADVTHTDVTLAAAGGTGDGDTAATYNGTTSRSVVTDTDLHITAEVSVFALVYLDGNTNWSGIAGIATAYDYPGVKYMLTFSGAGTAEGFPEFTTAAGAAATSADAVAAAGWHLLVGTWDNANIKIYVDGTLKDTTAHVTSNSYAGTEVFSIGQWGTAGRLDARVQKVGVVARALTQGELDDLVTAIPEDDAGAPTVSSATVLTEGNVLRMVFSESVTIGAGGNGGVTVTPSGGAATATYASGSGTNTLNYTLSRTLATSETLTRTYVQPGDGIEATSGGADVASFTTQAVTNNTINAPTIGTATATGTDAIDLTWTDNASNETQFEAQYDTADTFDVDPQTILVDTADVESTEAANLDPPGTEWFLRVRAKNGNGVSLWSDDVSATTDAEEAEAEEMPRSPAGWLRRRRLKF
jgi:hypothetical protein